MKKYKKKFEEATINRDEIDFNIIGGGIRFNLNTGKHGKKENTIDLGHYSGGRHNDIPINLDKFVTEENGYPDIKPEAYTELLKKLKPIADRYEKEILNTIKNFK